MFIIYFTYYSLLALDVVASEFAVSEYFWDERGRLPIDDLGFSGFDMFDSGSAS